MSETEKLRLKVVNDAALKKTVVRILKEKHTLFCQPEELLELLEVSDEEVLTDYQEWRAMIYGG